MLRFQDFDQPALPSPTGQGNSLSCDSTGRLSLVLDPVGKQGLSLKGEGEHSTRSSPAVLEFYTGKIQGDQC